MAHVQTHARGHVCDDHVALTWLDSGLPIATGILSSIRFENIKHICVLTALTVYTVILDAHRRGLITVQRTNVVTKHVLHL
jgi:hypothetical protein